MLHEIDLPVNPEPWAVGSVYTGRKNGGIYAGISPNTQLKVYQMAVKELVGIREFCVRPISAQFFFWRDMQEYTTERQRKARAHEADATNLQKALEDALQGCLYANDRDIVEVYSKIEAQGPGIESRIYLRVWDNQ